MESFARQEMSTRTVQRRLQQHGRHSLATVVSATLDAIRDKETSIVSSTTNLDAGIAYRLVFRRISILFRAS